MASNCVPNHHEWNAEEIAIGAGESAPTFDTAAMSEANLRSSIRRLIHVYHLAHDIYVQTDEQQLFEAIVSAVADLLGAERVFLAVREAGALRPRAAFGIDLGDDPDNWPVSGTMLRRVMESGVSLLTNDALHDTRYGNAPSVDLHNIRSVICCPLGPPEGSAGLIYADNRFSAGVFSRADVEFLRTLSHFAYLAVENARRQHRILQDKELAEARLAALREELAAGGDLIAASPQMVQLYARAKKVARSDVSVLISGETGTGKEVFARLIHAHSSRAAGPFVTVHVAALSGTLVESELFGHEKGAFTGADARRIGRFEIARGGTVFLDEVQDIPLDVQPKLLRVLEERRFERVGSSLAIEADIRIICASNCDLKQAVDEGALRPDLYYRLSGVTLEIPPLRERRDDIAPLLGHFLGRCAADKTFDGAAMARLAAYDWPGNVREIKHSVEALAALVDGPVIGEGDLPARMRAGAAPAGGVASFEPLPEIISRLEEQHIRRALEMTNGNNEEAIRMLGISRATFFKRKKQYGI